MNERASRAAELDREATSIMLGNLAKVILITCGLCIFLFAQKWEWSLPTVIVSVIAILYCVAQLVSIVKSYDEE